MQTRRTRVHKDESIRAERDRNYESLINSSKNTFWALLGLTLIYFRFSEQIASLRSGNVTLIALLPLVLVVITIVLYWLWVTSAEHELGLLKTYLFEYLPEKMFSARILTYVIPLFIVILALLATDVFYFSIVYWSYLSFDVWGRSTTTKKVIDSILSARLKSRVYAKELDEIKSYYDKPFEIRGYVTGGLVLSAFFFSFFSKYSNPTVISRDSLQIIAYLFVIASIVGGEISIWRWRSKYYRRMKQLGNS
jgi:hypothetical protein